MKMLEAHPIWRLFRKSENNDGGRAIFNYQNIYMKKMRLLYSCRRNMFGGCLENMKMIMEAEQYLIITKIFI